MSVANAASDLASILLEGANQRGWFCVRGISGLDVPALASAIGPPVRPRRGKDARSILQPYSSDAAPRGSMSAYTGTNPQPMHTDCAFLSIPPRYLLFHCLCPGEAPCATHIWTLDIGRLNR